VDVRRQRGRGYVCLGTAAGLTAARADPALRKIFQTIRGSRRPTACRSCGSGARRRRVYGPDLMLAVFDAGRASGLTHYFFGGAPGVADELKQKLCARFQPRGRRTFTPPFRPLDASELARWRADVARTRPDVVWVGLGTPKQEHFMAEHWSSLDAGVLIGVGAAFDFHSGRVRQAPRWIQRSGFEWLFRLCTEPRRLGEPRYLITTAALRAARPRAVEWAEGLPIEIAETRIAEARN